MDFDIEWLLIGQQHLPVLVFIDFCLFTWGPFCAISKNKSNKISTIIGRCSDQADACALWHIFAVDLADLRAVSLAIPPRRCFKDLKQACCFSSGHVSNADDDGGSIVTLVLWGLCTLLTICKRLSLFQLTAGVLLSCLTVNQFPSW